MIRKTQKGEFEVMDHTGTKILGGPYKTRKEAVERLMAIEYYKRKSEKENKK